MKKIVVTGNMGYVGPRVAQHLRQAFPSAHLAGYDAGYFAPCLVNRDLLPEALLDRQYFGDVREAPPAAVTSADAIVHLAGISDDAMASHFEKAAFDVNADATFELARQAKASGAKSFVYASTCAVYGAPQPLAAPAVHAEPPAFNEESELAPATSYAKSKVAAEKRLRLLAGDGFSITCLRFATACGFAPRLRLDLVLNEFTALAYRERAIQLLTDGSQWRALIHIDDMARAIEWAVSRSEGPDFLAVNTGSEEWTWRTRELAEAVARRFPGATVRANPPVPDAHSARIDFSLFRRLAPVHQPRMTLQAAIEGLAEGLEQANYRAEQQSWRHSRMKFLSHLIDRKLLLGANLRWAATATTTQEDTLQQMLGMSEGLLRLGDALRTSSHDQPKHGPDSSRPTRRDNNNNRNQQAQ